MSGLEIVGAVLGTVPLLISGLSHFADTYGFVKLGFRSFLSRCREYGIFLAIVLQVIFPDALRVMAKVEQYVILGQDQEAIAFMKSYTSSFNMIGVAGAIMAQVAITALSLTGLEDSHWTAEAFFVISLVTGALSVYFSCANSPSLHGLHSAEDIRFFLTKPSRLADRQTLNDMFLRTTEWQSLSVLGERQRLIDLLAKAREPSMPGDSPAEQRWKVASAHSAVMLVAPTYLLNASLSTFLVGLGIYLGKLFTAKLIPSFGTGSLGILLIYIGTTLNGLAIFYVAQSLKYIENLPRKRYHDPEDTANPDPAIPTARQDRTPEAHNGQTVRHLSGNEPLRSSPNQDIDVETARSSTDVLDSGMRPRYPPVPGQSLQLPDDNERPRSNNMPQSNNIPQSNGIVQGHNILQNNNMPQDNDMSPKVGVLADEMSILSVRAALIDQIRAQEELVQASKRLLEALEASPKLT